MLKYLSGNLLLATCYLSNQPVWWHLGLPTVNLADYCILTTLISITKWQQLILSPARAMVTITRQRTRTYSITGILSGRLKPQPKPLFLHCTGTTISRFRALLNLNQLISVHRTAQWSSNLLNTELRIS